MVVVAAGVVSVVMLLALLTLVSTLIGRRMPQILDALEAGARESVRLEAASLHAA